MKDTSELRMEIEDTKRLIGCKEYEIGSFEMDEANYKEAYEELLDEQGEIKIGCLSFSPSDVLREMDPIAYRCGLLDYIDGCEISDDDDYIKLIDELEELKAELQDLEESLEDSI